jgi:DNA-binding protein Fis
VSPATWRSLRALAGELRTDARVAVATEGAVRAAEGLGVARNTLRLWRAEAPEGFEVDKFNRGDYHGAVNRKFVSENITKVLYPNDDTMQGKALRLQQQAQWRPMATAVAPQDLESVLLAAEREVLHAALEACGGHHEAAWERLGIGKTSFYKKLKQHGPGRFENGTP